MLDPTYTRRHFLASTSFVAAAAVIPAAWRWPGADHAPAMLVSAESAPAFDLGPQAVLLDGPRLARLEAMAAALPKVSGEVVLRLDATDDALLDVAAQLAGVNMTRRNELPDGLGIRAHVALAKRNFA
jgi:hypothetical protein